MSVYVANARVKWAEEPISGSIHTVTSKKSRPADSALKRGSPVLSLYPVIQEYKQRFVPL